MGQGRCEERENVEEKSVVEITVQLILYPVRRYAIYSKQLGVLFCFYKNVCVCVKKTLHGCKLS